MKKLKYIIIVGLLSLLAYVVYDNWFRIMWAVADVVCPHYNVLSPSC